MKPERRLIGAILIRAVKDWDQPDQHNDVQAFLGTRWFGALAEGIDLDTASLRSKLAGGAVTGQGIRAAYRTRKTSRR